MKRYLSLNYTRKNKNFEKKLKKANRIWILGCRLPDEAKTRVFYCVSCLRNTKLFVILTYETISNKDFCTNEKIVLILNSTLNSFINH